jgi:hypothetical protein
MALLIVAAMVGSSRLVLGYFDDSAGTLVNLFWVGYDLVMLSVCIEALLYRPPEEATSREAAAPSLTVVSPSPEAAAAIAQSRDRAGAESA